MNPRHRIGGGEGQNAGEYLVEGDSQCVEIAAGIDRTIHAARLFGRHVGERSGDHLGRLGDLMLARKARCDAKAGQPDLAGREIGEDIGRLDILVDEATLMQPA